MLMDKSFNLQQCLYNKFVQKYNLNCINDWNQEWVAMIGVIK